MLSHSSDSVNNTIYYACPHTMENLTLGNPVPHDLKGLDASKPTSNSEMHLGPRPSSAL